MNIQDLIKLQFVSQFNSGAAQNRNAQQGAAGFVTIMHQFLFMLFMSVIDDVVKALPKFCEDAKSFFMQNAKKKMQDTLIIKPQELKDTSILLSTRHTTNSLVMTRTFNVSTDSSSSSSASRAASEESDGLVDSILAHISKLDNVPMLKLIDHGHIMISYKDKPIQITKDIFVKIDSIVTATGDAVSSIKLTLLSNTLSAAELATYAKNLYAKYQEELKNSLGNNIYFFDQKSRDGSGPSQLPPSADAETIRNHKRMAISTAPKNLSFTMSPFYSNKNFSNIFGNDVRTIEKRVNFFLQNRDWYDRKGVPYQLGLLLSGIPGAGKTSAIRAIANLTKRHIVNINFANITTATQLKNLFYSDKLTVYTDSTMSSSQTYFIPIEQRLYVLEEIDAIGDVVKQRKPEDMERNAQTINDELTLAEILTVLDGTMEVPGRIVIMTSNHPEVLDKALVRPGRIDVQVHFDNATRELIAEMFEAYLDRPFPRHMIDELPDRMLSPAEVGQVIFRNFAATEDHIPIIIKDLTSTANAKVPKELPRDDVDKEVDKEVDHEVDKEVDNNLDNLIKLDTPTIIDDQSMTVEAPIDTSNVKVPEAHITEKTTEAAPEPETTEVAPAPLETPETKIDDEADGNLSPIPTPLALRSAPPYKKLELSAERKALDAFMEEQNKVSPFDPKTYKSSVHLIPMFNENSLPLPLPIDCPLLPKGEVLPFNFDSHLYELTA
jgi:AAA+ superfamily predicted ATPase